MGDVRSTQRAQPVAYEARHAGERGGGDAAATFLSGASSTMGFEPEVIHEAEVDFTNIPVHDDADQEQFAAVSEPLLISTGGILLDMSSRNAPNNVPRRPRSPPAAIHPQPSTPSTGISNNYMAPIHGLSNAAVVHLPTPSLSDSQPGSRLSSPPDPASSQEIPNNNTDNITRGLQVIKDHGGTTNITQEQLQSIVPMEDDEIWRTFRRARCREAAAFSNLRRKIKLQTLRSNLVDVRRRNKECTERFHVLLHENRALRAAVEAGKAAAGE